MAYSNPKEAFENIVEGAKSGLLSAFPIKGRTHSLHLEDVAVEAKDTKDPMDIASQYKARMAGESWFTPLYGKLVIRDNATNAVVQSKKMRLMDLPTMTSRLSYIHKGQEYQVSDQWQLKPGVYARRRQNGELEARFNVTGRSAFDMTFDPESQKFQIEYKKANLPAYPILKALGVSDEELARTWGPSVLKANQELKRNATTLAQFHRTSTNGQTPATEQEAIDNLKKVMEASKLRPEVTSMTLGKPFENVTGEALLLAGKKLLHVQQGHPEDDRDAIVFKTLRATGELLHDQVKNAAKTLTHKIQRQINKGEQPKLRQVFSTGMFTAATNALFQSSLANPAKQINPLDMHSSALQTTIMGPGGIKSEMQVTDEAKMINASQFGFIDPLATPEGCHDPLTEVFTEEGWKRWPEVTEHDRFACLLEGRMHFEHATHLVAKKHVGEMYSVETDKMPIEYLVTPQHRMWVRPLDNECLGYRFETAEEMYGKDRRFQLSHAPYLGSDQEWFDLPQAPSSNPIANLNTVKNMDRVRYVDWGEFYGWFLSEGSIYIREDEKYCVKLFQSYPLHREYCEEIEDLLRRMGLKATIVDREEGRRVYSIPRKQIALALQEQGHSPERFIPSYFFSAPLEVRQALWNALMKGDGRKTYQRKDSTWQRQEVYTTTSPRLAHDVERLVATLGFASTHKVYLDKREARYLPVHEVRLLRRQTKQVLKRHQRKVEYAGMVYCATVPGGLLYVRRGGGVPHWSGNSSTGVSLRLPLGVKKIGEQPHIPLYNLKTKKTEWVDPVTAFNHKVVLADQVDFKDGVPHALHGEVRMMGVGNKLESGKLHEADYVMKHPSQIFNLTSAMVPFVGNDSGNRVSMAVRHMEQAISLQGREAPLVQSLSPNGSSFEKVFGHQIAHLSPTEGTVTKVTPKGITVQAADGKDHFVHLYDNYPLNDTKSVLHSEPKVKVGDKVGTGQLIADSNYTRDGHLALGKNLKVAYMSYHGKNFEDSFVVTESAAKKLSSIHLHKHELPIREDTVVGLKKFQVHNPGLFTQDQVKHIQEDGVIKVGSKVRPGDPLVLALQPFNIKDRVGLGALRKSLTNQHSDKSIRWEGSQEGEVVAVHRGPEGIQVHVHTVEPLQVADKLCFDEKTEVLTRTGWKPVAEVGLHDKVCTLVEGEIRYVRPSEVHSYAEGGRMYAVETQQIDLLVTANHRMYVQESTRNHDRPFKLVPAEQLMGKRVRYKKDGKWTGKATAAYGSGVLGLPGRWYLTILGMFLSEGCCVNAPKSGTYGIDIAQVKPEGRRELFAELDKMNIRYTKTPDRVRIHSKDALAPFQQFGKCKDKFIPDEVFDYPKEDLEVLFHWLMWGDGHTRENLPICYTTTSRQLADDVQRLCLHIGKAANIKTDPAHEFQQNGRTYLASERYNVRIINSKLTPEVNHYHVKEQGGQREEIIEGYDRPVYCVTVPGHVLYVRRNGKPCWSGNSNRHGGKGVVGYIIPDAEAPHGKDGKPVDILFQPAGVGGRMNVGQILETMAGKVAQKTGSTYFVKNFDGHIKDRVEELKKELKAHGLSDTEEITDPKTGLSYGQVLTGPQHFIKLVHQVDKKESVRSGMGLPKLPSNERYDSLTFQPASGDGTGGQSFGQLGLYALLAHGATNILRSAMTYKAQGEDPETNEAKRWKSDHALAWLAMQKGQPLPPPKPTFAYHRFTEMLKGAGINMEKKGSTLVISPLTDKHILEMSKGEITSPSAAVHAKIDPAINHYRPIKGGLFDEKITGGHGGTAWSHVKLAEPLPNPVFEEPIKKVLGITGPRFESILQGTVRVDPKTGKDSASGITGGAALKAMLDHIEVDSDLKKTKEDLKKATPSAADALYKKARYLQALQKLGMKPSEAYILHNVPILPPKLRPLSIMEDGKLRYEDVNGLYMQMGQMNEELTKPEMKMLPDSAKASLRQNLYDSIKNIYGTGSLPEGSKQKGLLQTIHGTSPKLGLVQKGLLSPRQDMTMRSVIIPGPDLHLDQVGLPKESALTLFRPFVIHQLVKQGTARNENHAQDLLSEVHRGKHDPMVWKALEQVVAERPVLLKRDPALHKYSLQSFYATLVGGSSIKLHPLVTGGFNADHDGDSCEGPVLLSTPEGLTKVELSDFPRIEESKRAAGPNTDAYDVPRDLFVFGMQDSTMKLYRVTEYSVHKNLHVWEVLLSSGEKIRCSSDHSLACLDMHTLKATKFIPNEAVGHAVPTLGLLEGHLFDEFKLDETHVRSASPELGEEIGKFLAYKGGKQTTPQVFELLGLSLSHPEGVKPSSPEGEAWTKLLSEDFLRKAVLYPLAFRQALLTRFLQQRLHQDDSTAKCSDQEGLFLLSRSVGLSCIKRGATLVVYEASSLIQASWFKPQGWRKKARLRGGYFSQVPFPAWVQDECPVKYRKESPQGWLRRDTLQVLLKELEEKGMEPSGYFANWRRMVTMPHLFWERVEAASPTGERRDLYDITVESAQNFLLSTGTLVWDTMSVFVPSTHEEIHDALKMLPSRNIFSDTTGAPAFTPSMESQLGLHRLSKVGDKTAHVFKTHEEVADALARQKVKVNDQVSLAGKMTTPGRVLLASAVPAAFKEKLLHDLSFELTGKGTKTLFHDVGKHSPSLFPTFADEMKQLGYDAATGMIRTPLTKHKVIPIGAHSYSLEDFSTDKATRDKHLGVAAQEIANLPKNLPEAERERQVVDAYLAAINKMTKEHTELSKDPATRKNNLQAMTAAGIKPSAGQYQQMRLLPGIMSDSKGNLIPTPIATSYGEGLDLGAYWIGSYGARSGTVKKVQEVQEPGYMTKLLQNTSMGTLIDQHDCGTRKGILMPVTHSDITDRHLAQDLKLGNVKLQAGALLDKRTLDSIRTIDPGAKLLVRSPLECASEKGVCQKCFGLNANGHHHAMGTNIGVLSAHALGERAVQLTLKAFHCTHEHTVVTCRSGGRVYQTTLGRLFERATLQTVEGEEVVGRFPEEVEVRDAGGWTRIKNVRKHPQQPGTSMALVRTQSGEGVISQSNHPHMLHDGDPLNVQMVSPEQTPEKAGWFAVPADPTTHTPVLPPLKSGWLAGIYCAEGSLVVRQEKGAPYLIGLQISQKQDSPSYPRILQELVEEYGPGAYGGCGRYYQLYGVERAKHYESSFGRYSRNKGLPDGWLGFGDAWLAAFVSGVVDGDGTLQPNHGSQWFTCRIDTTSWLLAQQLHQILTHLGLRSRVLTTPWRKASLHQGYAVTFSVTDKAQAVLSTCGKLGKVQGKPWEEVQATSEIDYVRPVTFQAPPFVYDLETESHTFFANGILTHNSGGAVTGRGGGALGAFQRLEQLTYLPDKTPNSAVLAKVTGKVTGIEHTNTGVQVHVDGIPHFVGKDPTGLDLHTELTGANRDPKYQAWKPPVVGDTVVAGQHLSDPNRTLVNPHRLYEATKDIGKVKEFLASEMHRLYEEEGVRKRAVEVVVRSMGNITKIEDAKDHPDLLRGQFYPRSAVLKINEERKKAGQPLIEHRPTLMGVNLLPLAATEDWLAVLNHQKLRSTLMQNAALGAKSDLHGHHPIPGLIYGAEFGKPKGGTSPY